MCPSTGLAQMQTSRDAQLTVSNAGIIQQQWMNPSPGILHHHYPT